MKKAASIWCFEGGTPYRDAFRRAKQAGFDGVELALEESGPLGLTCMDKDLAQIRQTAQEEGIELFSLATGLYWSYSLTSYDKNVRDKARDVVKKQLECAKVLGCDTILVLPGHVSAGGDVVRYDDAYQMALEAMQALKGEAEALQVSIGLENVWNKFLLSPLEMRNLIDQIDSPYVGAYFDVGNVIAFGYPEQWIRILGNRIKKVHFKDHREAASGDGFVDLLNGDVNWPEVMRAFRDIGYDDYVTAELSPYRYFPDEMLKTAARAMDRILQEQ